MILMKFIIYDYKEIEKKSKRERYKAKVCGEKEYGRGKVKVREI